MKKLFTSIVTTTLMLGLGILATQTVAATEIQPRVAEGEAQEEAAQENKTGITLSPATRTIQLSSNTTYDGAIAVTNDGTGEITVEVFATPYSYVYSQENDSYLLGYSFENSFTQLSRWIKIKGTSGNYETKPSFKLKPGETREVKYKITTPNNIPAGGQYAVIFAQVRSGAGGGAIKADPGLGMIIYGHSTEGENVTAATVRNMTLEKGFRNNDLEEENKKEVVFGRAKVKNTGNVDFFARAVLKAEPIIGFSGYETSAEKSLTSVIPESELTMSDEWADLPWFGLYKVTWTISNIGDQEPEVVERIMFFCNPMAIIFIIILLTIIIMSVIIAIKRRKVRRSRLAI